MQARLSLILVLVSYAAAGLAQSSRFVIDDDEYLDRVTATGAKLARESRLRPLRWLQQQVHTGGFAFKPAPLARERLPAPDLLDRLRESTLAVGIVFKCRDCGNWHFDSSAGFVVAEGGVICTCCHVLLAKERAAKEAYFVAADASGQVFPVLAVLAADTESDTCLLRIDAPALRPLPLRADARAGEHVYCLSHPGGYHFMFTEGMIARLNRKRNEALDQKGQLTRPILFLNVTAEFAPGSSGAPIVDQAGNVVAQVASIADAGEPDAGDKHTAASPSVPIRFCTAAEEILRLGNPELGRATRIAPPVKTKRKNSTRPAGSQGPPG